MYIPFIAVPAKAGTDASALRFSPEAFETRATIGPGFRESRDCRRQFHTG